MVDKHLGRYRRCGTSELSISLAKAFCRHWHAFSIGHRQLGLSSRGSMALCSVRRACGLCYSCMGHACFLLGHLDVSCVWLLRGQFRKTRDHLSTLYHGHLSNLSGVRRTLPTPILLEELGQQPLADMWLVRAAGFWNSLMTGSAFHKAMAQDAVRLSQMTGTKGWVAGLSKALQAAAYAFQPQHLHSIDIGHIWATFATYGPSCTTQHAAYYLAG